MELLTNPIIADRYKLMVTPKEQETFLIMQGAKAIHADIESYYGLIIQTYTYKGMKTAGLEDELVIQAKLFKAEVATFYKSISFAEVKLAIENALRATVDRLEYPSIESYSLAIKRYLNATETLEAKRAVLARLNPPTTPELTLEEKEAISQAGFERIKAKVLANETIVNDPGAIGCYNWLKAKGKLNGIMNEQEREAIKERATDLLHAEYTAEADTLNKDKRRTALKKAQDLIAGLLENDLISLCKKLSLEYLIKNGKV
jgi:hypothetical protein